MGAKLCSQQTSPKHHHKQIWEKQPAQTPHAHMIISINSKHSALWMWSGVPRYLILYEELSWSQRKLQIVSWSEAKQSNSWEQHNRHYSSSILHEATWTDGRLADCTCSMCSRCLHWKGAAASAAAHDLTALQRSSLNSPPLCMRCVWFMHVE